MKIKEELNAFIRNKTKLEEGYSSWGKVNVISIAVRDGEEILTDKKMYEAIFASRKNINCIMVTRQEYADKIKEEIPPILDDQAQLLGVSVRIADISDPQKANSNIVSALKRRYAAVLSDGRSICIGSTVDDTYVAAQLLEKTSKAWLEAKYLGGAVPINRFEAWAMQMYYQFKYAKEAKKNR